MAFRVNTRVLYTLFSAVVIVAGTYAAIQYAKGHYRITRQGFVAESGLLSANSFPPGAEVLINGDLLTATDDTVYLPPGTYEVEITKEGYWPWKKTLELESQLVTQTNAQLFPVAPSLTPLTFTGVNNAVPSPDGQKIAYYTASASAQTKNGLYVQELNNNPLSLQRGPRQLSENTPTFNLATAQYIWSPDSTQLLVISETKHVLIETDRKSDLTVLPDVSFRTQQILSEWEEEMYLRERQYLAEFPAEIIQIATSSAQNVYFSPNKKRLLYTYTGAEEVTLAEGLTPPVPAASTQQQERTLQAGNVYVYDREEDRNFLVGQAFTDESKVDKLLLATDLFQRSPRSLESSPSAFRNLQATQSARTVKNFHTYHTPLYANTFQWFPDSNHLLYTGENRIMLKEIDNSNDTTVYSGPFTNSFVYPWPDGSKLLILTSFSPETPINLYAIELK
jgi:hypothetical protein